MALMRCMLVLFLLLALPALGAPELTQAQRDRLADGTEDGTADLDRLDGLYVLLTNAAGWAQDDFAGDAGEKTAPQPDYDYVLKNPGKVRGKVYLVEGLLKRADRFPTQENLGRDSLKRTGELLGAGKAWGRQLTRWSILTDADDPDSTVIVLFHDPGGRMPQHKEDTPVRVAARFFKLWTTVDSAGKPHTFMVFVGGAAEKLPGGASAMKGGGPSSRTVLIIAIAVVAIGFYVIRFMLAKKTAGGGQLRQRLEQIRHERERYEEDEDSEEESAEDLPEDPVEALGVLRDKHESD